MKKVIILTAAMFLFTTCEKTETEKVESPPIIEIVSPLDGHMYFDVTWIYSDYIPITIKVRDLDGWIEEVFYKLFNTNTHKTIKRQIKNIDYDGFYSAKVYFSQIESGDYIFEVTATDNDNITSKKESEFLVREL